MACASGTERLPVQLKREIGKLWDDISKAPYKELFNASIPGIHVWHCVQVQRRIDRALESYLKRGGDVEHYGVATHGNRLIGAMVFEALPMAKFREPSFDLESIAPENIIVAMCDNRLDILAKLLDTHYPNSIIPTLFKNLKKCEHLMKEARPLIST